MIISSCCCVFVENGISHTDVAVCQSIYLGQQGCKHDKLCA